MKEKAKVSIAMCGSQSHLSVLVEMTRKGPEWLESG